MENIRTSRSEWQSGIAKNISFIVTKDCQLACKYCYLVGKNSKERMSWKGAKPAIDYVLDHEDEMKEESVIWDFIGGEPFLGDRPYRQDMRLSQGGDVSQKTIIGSTPIASLSPQMASITEQRKYSGLSRRTDNISPSESLSMVPSGNMISIVSWKTKEMEQGIKPKPEEERGSYEDVVKNIPLWLEQFPNASTKVTISSADIPYIKESVSASLILLVSTR